MSGYFLLDVLTRANASAQLKESEAKKMDYAAAQKRVKYYRGQLTRLQNKQNHHGIIALWSTMQAEFDREGWALPDSWSRWARAAEDAHRAIHPVAGW